MIDKHENSVLVWDIESNHELSISLDEWENQTESLDPLIITPDEKGSTIITDGLSNREILKLQNINPSQITVSPLNNFLAILNEKRESPMVTSMNIDAVVSIYSSFEEYAVWDRKDSTVTVYDLNTGNRIASVVIDDIRADIDDKQIYICFSPNEKFIGILCDQSTILVHYWYVEDLIDSALMRLNRNFTMKEWRHFMGDEPYRKTSESILEEVTDEFSALEAGFDTYLEE